MEESDTPGIISQEYGINSRTTFLDLQYFDPCSGAFLPDVMHDVLEGALQYELKLVLKHLIDECHCFHISTLNERIEGMELGYMETSRPEPITTHTLRSDDNTLKQKGPQYIVNVSFVILHLF